jgi:hypothetical protein
MKWFLLPLAALALMGCQDRYRYDCQDPANWEVPECQKPKCVASGYCTEYLITTEEEAHEAH